ncbi:hypothetical protein D3C72_2084770 [compost metagenome]
MSAPARDHSTLIPLVGGCLALFGIQRRIELEVSFFPLVQRIFLNPFGADFDFVIIPVENSLSGSAAA